MKFISDKRNLYITKELSVLLSSLCNNSQATLFHNELISENKELEVFKPDVQRKEIVFFDKLDNVLSALYGITGLRQYKVLSYRIDYYIYEKNIAIEYDENNHIGYTYEQHEGRQKDIEEMIECKFIRLSDRNTDEYNIKLVLDFITKQD